MMPKNSRIPPTLRAAFLLFAFAIPLDAIPIDEGRNSLTKVIGYLLFPVAVCHPHLCFRRPPKALVWFLGYMAMFAVTAIPSLEDSWKPIIIRFLSQLQLLVMMWIAYNLLQDDRLASETLLAFALGGVLITALTLSGIGVTELVNSEGRRVSVRGQNVNMLGSALGSGVVILASLAFHGHWRNPGLVRLLILPFVAAMLLSLANTGSRGATLAVGAGLATFLFQVGPPRAKLRACAGMAIVCTLLVTAICVTDVVRTRWNNVIRTRTIASRETLYKSQLEMLLEKPLFGWGPIDQRHELGRRENVGVRESVDAHNLVLHVLTQVGLVGAIPFFMGLWWAVRSAWRARYGPRGVLPFALLSLVLVASMATNVAAFKYFWFIVAFALASGRPFFAVRRPSLPRTAREPVVAA